MATGYHSSIKTQNEIVKDQLSTQRNSKSANQVRSSAKTAKRNQKKKIKKMTTSFDI